SCNGLGVWSLAATFVTLTAATPMKARWTFPSTSWCWSIPVRLSAQYHGDAPYADFAISAPVFIHKSVELKNMASITAGACDNLSLIDCFFCFL
ncbi:hypothetical protein, partial [Pseudomonas indica]|uniref:hypothetical protein n=1 Tax=Pseudomonas indica TaxID=137658 RepID=UPI001C3E9715